MRLVYFWFSYQGETLKQTGLYNPETQEIKLPSGYMLPVENGYVSYLGQTTRVFYSSNNQPLEA